MIDSIEFRTLEICQLQTGRAIGGEQVFRSNPRSPTGPEVGKQPRDLAEVHAIASLVGCAAGGVFDLTAGNGLFNNVRQVSDLIILIRAANVKRLIVD